MDVKYELSRRTLPSLGGTSIVRSQHYFVPPETIVAFNAHPLPGWVDLSYEIGKLIANVYTFGGASVADSIAEDIFGVDIGNLITGRKHEVEQVAQKIFAEMDSGEVRKATSEIEYAGPWTNEAGVEIYRKITEEGKAYNLALEDSVNSQDWARSALIFAQHTSKILALRLEARKFFDQILITFVASSEDDLKEYASQFAIYPIKGKKVLRRFETHRYQESIVLDASDFEFNVPYHFFAGSQDEGSAPWGAGDVALGAWLVLTIRKVNSRLITNY